MTAAPPIRYNAKILKGGLLFDTMRTLVMAFDPGLERDAFRERVRAEGALASLSERRQNDVLMLFNYRYVETVQSFPALQRLLEFTPPKSQALLLYLHAAQGDTLLRDFVTDKLLAAFYEGRVELSTERAREWVEALLAERDQSWSAYACKKAAWSLLALLRDAGLSEGIQRKRIKYPFVPLEVATYLIYHLRAQGFTTGKRVLEHPDWQLLLQRQRETDALMARVAEAGFITWAAAGSLYRLDFPYAGLEEVTRALVH